MFYVYRHVRLDTGLPFYIGKGKCNRAYVSCGRNKHWKNIVNCHGYEVEIVLDNLTEKEALDKEVEFINMYKKLGYCEANYTSGGENPTISEDSKKRMSESALKRDNTNVGHRFWSERQRIAQSNLKRGLVSPRKGCVASKESIEKCIQTIEANSKHFYVFEKYTSNFICIFKSQTKCAISLFGNKKAQSKISDILNGYCKRNSYKGYVFKFLTN